jgi:hypothetical protein
MRIWRSIGWPARLALALVATAVVAPVAWYLGSPLVITTTVDEAFPVVAGAAPLATVAASPAAATPAARAPMATATPPAAIATASAPAPATATLPPPTTAALPPTATPAAPPPTAAPPAPVALLRGQFTRIDALHHAEGTATIYRLPDGQRILRFEPFRAANGPGLFVYLAGHPRPRSSGELHGQGAVELAPLKATTGNQNYALPPDLDLAAFKSVVIYCKPFSVVFSTAALG